MTIASVKKIRRKPLIRKRIIKKVAEKKESFFIVELLPQIIDITPWTKKASLCEIGQPVGMKYSFISVDNKQCHAMVKCRDFLQDALRNYISGKKDGIYGFTYDPAENPPLDLERMRMLVTVDGPNMTAEEKLDIFMHGLTMLRFLEIDSDIKPLSTLSKTNQSNMFLFEGSKEWMGSSFMISLYTFILRLGAKKIQFKDKEEFNNKMTALCKKGGDHDVYYLQSAWPYIYKILQKRNELRYMQDSKKPLFDGQTIGLFHNYTGIVSLAEQADNKELRASDEKLKDLFDLSRCLR